MGSQDRLSQWHRCCNILWKLGYQGDFAMTQGIFQLLIQASDFSFQHFPSIINQTGSQTTLAVRDNGDSRVLDSSGTTCGAAPSLHPIVNLRQACVTITNSPC